MNKKLKDLTVKLKGKLQLETYRFLIENLNKEENTTDLINLILSGHLSSLFSCMIEVSNDLENSESVKLFINNLKNYISTLEMIKKTEIL